MLVSVIIVNYKDYAMTSICLESLKMTTYRNHEVIVVDNESDKEKLGKMIERFPQVKFIRSEENLNYAGGNNLGIKHARGDLIVLLNNDTKVSTNWLEPLVASAEREPMAFYQPKILFMDDPDTINSMGNTMNVFGFPYPLDIGKKDYSSEPKEVFYCSGACVMTSRQVVDKIGLLDSNYYTYWEDVNWGWRGRLEGISSWVIPTSVIYHKWGGSYSKALSPHKFFLLERGRISSLFRNFSIHTLVILIPSLVLIDIALTVYCVRRGFFTNKVRATFGVLGNIGRLMQERKKLQARRTVADSGLFWAMNKEINHPYIDSSPIGKKVVNALSSMSLRIL
jgi:GT2 family glycosyltransferase